MRGFLFHAKNANEQRSLSPHFAPLRRCEKCW